MSHNAPSMRRKSFCENSNADLSFVCQDELADNIHNEIQVRTQAKVGPALQCVARIYCGRLPSSPS